MGPTNSLASDSKLADGKEGAPSNGFSLPSISLPKGGGAIRGIGRTRRLIKHVRILYRKDDLTALLPLRELEPLALPRGKLQAGYHGRATNTNL
jgi:hypothetical protein